MGEIDAESGAPDVRHEAVAGLHLGPKPSSTGVSDG